MTSKENNFFDKKTQTKKLFVPFKKKKKKILPILVA
jgi:hypothetical protein